MPRPDLPPVSRRDLLRIAAFLRRHVDADDRQKAVQKLIALWQSTGFVAPFDWQGWLRRRGAGVLTDPAFVASADLETLRRLATAHMRTNRFVDGHLEQLLASGYLDRMLDRLRRIVDTDG